MQETSTDALRVMAVRAVVRHARDDGATWQVVGDALGVTRRAAFQRYGRPIDPRTGEIMTTTPLPGVATLATSVIGDLTAGRWARVAGLSGAFEQHGDPAVARVGDVTITDTPLAFEAGDHTARTTSRDDRTLTGLHSLDRKTP